MARGRLRDHRISWPAKSLRSVSPTRVTGEREVPKSMQLQRRSRSRNSHRSTSNCPHSSVIDIVVRVRLGVLSDGHANINLCQKMLWQRVFRFWRVSRRAGRRRSFDRRWLILIALAPIGVAAMKCAARVRDFRFVLSSLAERRECLTIPSTRENAIIRNAA